jgi:glucose-6-phosphate isomerase
VIWGINAFDQWGVELGKRIASSLLPAVASAQELAVADPVTQALLAEIRRRR